MPVFANMFLRRTHVTYSTDPTLTPRQIVSWFTGRWSIEVTFEEVRSSR
jgi:hypothetical protein